LWQAQSSSLSMGAFIVAFERRRAEIPSIFIFSPRPTQGDDAPMAVTFVENSLSLASISPNLSTLKDVEAISGLYDLIANLRLSDDKAKCSLDSSSTASLRGLPTVAMTCLGALGDNAPSTLSASSHAFVADFVESADTEDSLQMIGIAAKDSKAATILQLLEADAPELQKFGSGLGSFIEETLPLSVSSVILTSSAGSYRNVLSEPSIDYESDSWRSPVVGKAYELSAPRSEGVPFRIPGANTYMAGRVDDQKGVYAEIKAQNSAFSKTLWRQIFSKAPLNTLAAAAGLEGSFADYFGPGDASLGLAPLDEFKNQGRFRFSTPLRGDVEWPGTGTILRQGASIVHQIQGWPYRHSVLLSGLLHFEFARALPLSFQNVKYPEENDRIVRWRAEGDMQILTDSSNGELRAEGLVRFRTRDGGPDPRSLNLSRYINFWKGVVGISTRFKEPYIRCLGIDVKSSWGKLDEDVRRDEWEEHYRHAVTTHFNVARATPANRIVDAYSIEATLTDVSALELMRPFIDLASTPEYSPSNERLLSSVKISSALVIVHEPNSGLIMDGNVMQGCLSPPKRTTSSIILSNVRLTDRFVIRTHGDADIVLQLDLSMSGPGSYADISADARSRHAVFARGTFMMHLGRIGSFRLLSSNFTHGAFHYDGKSSSQDGHFEEIVATMKLSTELMGSGEPALELDLKAQVATLGVTWKANVSLIPSYTARQRLESALPIPERCEEVSEISHHPIFRDYHICSLYPSITHFSLKLCNGLVRVPHATRLRCSARCFR